MYVSFGRTEVVKPYLCRARKLLFEKCFQEFLHFGEGDEEAVLEETMFNHVEFVIASSFDDDGTIALVSSQVYGVPDRELLQLAEHGLESRCFVDHI